MMTDNKRKISRFFSSRLLATSVVLSGVSALASVAFVALTPQSVRAQQVETSIILGIDVAEDRCMITVADEDEQIRTEMISVETCEQLTVGDHADLIYEVVDVQVQPLPEFGTITSLVAGDRACYIGLDTETGDITQFASFSICEIEDVIGAVVRPIYEPGDVLAFSCGGDIDCGRTDRVNLITSIVVLEGGPPAPDRNWISSLPDGNYRYWSKAPAERIDEEELMFAEGVLFRFSKRGNNVTGIFSEIGGDAICVQGQVNQYTVSGIAVRIFPEATVLSAGEDFVSFLPGGRLKVRRGQQLPSNRFLPLDGRRIPINIIRYNSALLDLSGLNQINAGTVLPPERCAQS